MRISDWSSDVCSSDLAEEVSEVAETGVRRGRELGTGEGARSPFFMICRRPVHQQPVIPSAARDLSQPRVGRLADSSLRSECQATLRAVGLRRSPDLDPKPPDPNLALNIVFAGTPDFPRPPPPPPP